MRPNSPSAIVTSLILHGFVAAIIFVTTVYLARSTKMEPVIFELVAGPPTAPDELVAPALGNTTAPVKLTVPQAEVPPDKPEPVVQETVAVPEPAVKTPPAKTTPVKPKSDLSLAKDLKKSARVSYQEYLKKHPTPKQSVVSTVRRAANAPKVDYQGIANGVRGGSTEMVGTSTPTAALPGIGARMRTDWARMPRAMFLSRPEIFSTRTPAAGMTS